MLQHGDVAAHAVEHDGEDAVGAVLGVRHERLLRDLQQPISGPGGRYHLLFVSTVAEYEILVSETT